MFGQGEVVGEAVMMCPRLRSIYQCALGVLGLAVCLQRPIAAQESAQLTMPLSALREIALDFDSGRNTIYCYYGSFDTSASRVHVDSLQVVSALAQCGGVGVGFISRLGDMSMMAAMLNGLITSHPSFRIVTAFYGAEDMHVEGMLVRAARALSVLRGEPVKQTTYGT